MANGWAPAQKVLLLNPRSGGGKAERFHLADRCGELGIEPVVLGEGDDLQQLAERAVARGADLLGMAGGDGSQGVVASVASRHGVPFVVVPAGTRNHFAMDLGLDPDDVAGALEAFVDGVGARIDLGEINGRLFVNNVSIGFYGTVVQSPEYRDAKVRTALATLPDVLGPHAPAPDLRFTLPSGREATTAQVILVSNNPYRLPAPHGAARERLDGGVLGVAVVMLPRPGDVERLAELEEMGQVRQFPGWQEWTATDFTVDSGEATIDLGVDGEAVTLDPPLRFKTRPGALLVRLPRAAADRSADRRATFPTTPVSFRDLLRLTGPAAETGGPEREVREQPTPGPAEGGLAIGASARRPSAAPDADVRLFRRLRRWDRRAYHTVAHLSTPALDQPLRTVSRLADHSKPWLVISAVLAAKDDPLSRRAGFTGLAAIAATSLLVNQPLKWWGARRRPDRAGVGVPRARWVRMPESTSFPSGHAASAAAFAAAVGDVMPRLRVPLGAAATVVGFSRVYTGVHYPSDVLAGALIGVAVGRSTSALAARVAASIARK